MHEGKKNNKNSKTNNSNTNLIGLGIFVGMFILIVIVIVIFTKSILPSSGGSSSSSMLVADSNLGIHTDTTTQPVSTTSINSSSSQINNNDDDYDDYNNNYNQQGTKMTVKSSVNVRSGPGSDNKQIGEIAAGTEITVFENKGGWYRILFNGSTNAYVYSSYVEGSLPEASSGASNGYDTNITTTTSANYAQYGQQNSFADTSGNNGGYYNN